MKPSEMIKSEFYHWLHKAWWITSNEVYPVDPKKYLNELTLPRL